MVWYDFAVLALLVYTMWSGAQRGFVTQLAWIVALVLCFKFADKLAPAIEPQINVEQPLRHWIAMLVLYLAFSLGSFMVARILNSWMEKAKFKDFDRHLGGLLGLMKGGVIAMVVTFFAVTLSESLRATVMKSYTGPAACYILDTVEPITPDHFKDYLAQYHRALGEEAHQGHLGHQTDPLDAFGNELDSVPMPPDHSGGSLLDDFRNLTGFGSKSDIEGDPAPAGSFSDLLESIPMRLSSSAQQQLQQQWKQSSTEQRQNLLKQVDQALGTQTPDILRNFMAETGQGGGGNQPSQPNTIQLMNTLKSIGDIYGDRDYIVQQALTRLDGVPTDVQQAVIDDWYADWSYQPTDPDPSTARDTALDDRIMSQVNKRSGVWERLSLDLRRRLANSRQ